MASFFILAFTIVVTTTLSQTLPNFDSDSDSQNNSVFSYTFGNVAGRREIAKGINKVSGAPNMDRE